MLYRVNTTSSPVSYAALQGFLICWLSKGLKNGMLFMKYLGKGIYTVPAASRILGIGAPKMRRWISGYTYYSKEEHRAVKPIFDPDFNPADAVISFLDLMELLLIKSFVQHGVSIKKIREVAAIVSSKQKTSHPLAIRKMYTDGKWILAQTSDKSLIDLINKQYQLGEIVEPLLYGCIDFNVDEYAEKWWPNGKGGGIVLDPMRNMGQPILDNYNVRTKLIYELYKADHSIDEISDWYELDKAAVEAAVGFEKGLVA